MDLIVWDEKYNEIEFKLSTKRSADTNQESIYEQLIKAQNIEEQTKKFLNISVIVQQAPIRSIEIRFIIFSWPH